jgi:predicted transcriptional regulator
MSQTTSIRLDADLRRALEREAESEGRGLNWILSRAAEEYLKRRGLHDLETEARRQSLVASGAESGDWSSAADFESWK